MKNIDLTVQAAGIADLEDVRRLLEECALPEAGVGDQWPNAYVVVKDHQQVVASAGLERYEDEGLLRSLAVAPHLRGIGLGVRLLHDRLNAAKQLGMSRVFLLTTTVPEFFLNHGFVPAKRESANSALRSSPEFTTACPATATCLVRNLEAYDESLAE